MNNWQPIETAPKDGSVILVYKKDYKSFDYNSCVAVVFSINPDKVKKNVGHEYFDEFMTYYNHCHDYNECNGLFEEPTHWMPLPEPPK